MSKLSKWFEFMVESELSNSKELGLGVEFENEMKKMWKFEGEDRDIVLEDLSKDGGLLYKKMVEYNENELVVKLDVGMDCWEYSLEDYFRDMFDKNGYEKDEFSMFELKDINKMMYGNDYEE